MDDAERDKPQPTKPTRRPERLAREAAALRANLHKRKDQARRRAEAPTDEGERQTEPEPT